MSDFRAIMLAYHPSYVLDEDRRELEREQELRRNIREARRQARERKRASRSSPLWRWRLRWRGTSTQQAASARQI